nr:MAG TPA: hypothetical protein [Caudoviricetes sp.]
MRMSATYVSVPSVSEAYILSSVSVINPLYMRQHPYIILTCIPTHTSRIIKT